ncbi:MAG: DUF3106 domain-containing protein [Burkholderiaceae bacterium]|nr:DUF3106 domain-containing protein [Burkholderiaceae bacterium]
MTLVCALAPGGSVLAQPAGAAASVPLPAPIGSIGWQTLTSEQRTALLPLAGLWPTLNPEHQRKWIALAHNYNRMSADEQSTLQQRMTRWAKLPAAKRTEARQNFGEVRRVPTDEKRAKWEAYQELPAEERDRLARRRSKPPVSAAPALRPVPANRIVQPSAPPTSTGPGIAPSNSKNPPVSVNRNTLLPQPTASAPPQPGIR